MPILEREGLTLKKDFPSEDIEVKVDVEKLARVFENLIEKARKYSSGPSEITVTLIYLPDKVRISLANKVDTLPTHPPEKLFERFYKRDTSRSEEHSSGLGLAIAQKVIELHKGHILANYLTDAIEFVIEIPLYIDVA